MNFKKKSVIFLATGGYIGYMPKAPGTFGSLWGLVLGYGFSRLTFPVALVCLMIFAGAGVWISHQAQKIMGKKDPGCIVIDEMIGLVIGLFGLPFNGYTPVFGFLAFRVFDIAKPWPVGWIDRNCPGGLGVVLDDMAAGVYANLVLRLGLFLCSIF